MDYTQLNEYKQKLHQQTLAEVLQKNEEQIKNWTDYQNKHKSVLEGLKILPLELSVNCLIPIGKQALMAGKLQHTNEILVCLGDGYFVNYSAAQATELANRRIKRTEEVLKCLQDERNLFESRQNFSSNFGAFVRDDSQKELLEHWNDEDLEKWRIQHRQREKEYHEKKSQQKQEEKQEEKPEEKKLSTEEELFRRLDELELEEELADEYYRSQENQDDDFVEDEEDEEDEDDELNEEEKEIYREYEEHIQRKKEIFNEKAQSPEISLNPSCSKSQENQSDYFDESDELNEEEREICREYEEHNKRKKQILSKKTKSPEISLNLPTSEETSDNHTNKSLKKVGKGNDLDLSKAEPKTRPVKDRRVSFLDSYVAVSPDNSDSDTCKKKVRESNVSDEDMDYENDVENIGKINFSHSDVSPQMTDKVNSVVNNPADIYNTFFKPKSILKRSKNDLNTYVPKEPAVDKYFEIDNSGSSVYDDVVTKVVQEKKLNNVETTEPVIQKKPVSRFRLERATLNK